MIYKIPIKNVKTKFALSTNSDRLTKTYLTYTISAQPKQNLKRKNF